LGAVAEKGEKIRCSFREDGRIGKRTRQRDVKEGGGGEETLRKNFQVDRSAGPGGGGRKEISRPMRGGGRDGEKKEEREHAISETMEKRRDPEGGKEKPSVFLWDGRS